MLNFKNLLSLLATVSLNRTTAAAACSVFSTTRESREKIAPTSMIQCLFRNRGEKRLFPPPPPQNDVSVRSKFSVTQNSTEPNRTAIFYSLYPRWMYLSLEIRLFSGIDGVAVAASFFHSIELKLLIYSLPCKMGSLKKK